MEASFSHNSIKYNLNTSYLIESEDKYTISTNWITSNK